MIFITLLLFSKIHTDIPGDLLASLSCFKARNLEKEREEMMEQKADRVPLMRILLTPRARCSLCEIDHKMH